MGVNSPDLEFVFFFTKSHFRVRVKAVYVSCRAKTAASQEQLYDDGCSP